MVESLNYQAVKRWRALHPETHKERNRLYTKRRWHYNQQIKAFYNIDLSFFV